jgi:hypothetical protein
MRQLQSHGARAPIFNCDGMKVGRLLFIGTLPREVKYQLCMRSWEAAHLKVIPGRNFDALFLMLPETPLNKNKV